MSQGLSLCMYGSSFLPSAQKHWTLLLLFIDLASIYGVISMCRQGRGPGRCCRKPEWALPTMKDCWGKGKMQGRSLPSFYFAQEDRIFFFTDESSFILPLPLKAVKSHVTLPSSATRRVVPAVPVFGLGSLLFYFIASL